MTLRSLGESYDYTGIGIRSRLGTISKTIRIRATLNTVRWDNSGSWPMILGKHGKKDRSTKKGDHLCSSQEHHLYGPGAGSLAQAHAHLVLLRRNQPYDHASQITRIYSPDDA